MSRGGARPGAGRKRKSPELKALAGTQRKDREVSAEVPGDGPMVAPIHLSDHEQLEFATIAGILEGQNRASPHFVDIVSLLAMRLAQVQRLKAVLEVEGDTFTSRRQVKNIVTTMVRARPEVAMLSEAMRHAQSLCGDLMLTPSTALKLASGHRPEEGAFDDF